MNRAGAEPHERLLMRARAVADVPGEAVTGIEPIVFPHEAIARDLGQDRSGGDGDRELISPNDRPLGDVHIGEAHGVNEKVVRTGMKPRDRRSHRALGRAPDIGAINLRGVHDSESQRARRVPNRVVEGFSAAAREAFGIVQTLGETVQVKDHGSGDDRPGPCPAPDFIYARNEPIAQPLKFLLQSGRAR